MRKRGFKRHHYTVVREDKPVGGGTDYVLLRGIGSVEPTSRQEKVQTPTRPSVDGGEIQAELTLFTQDPYPEMDGTGLGSPAPPDDHVGSTYSPDYVIWQGEPFITISYDGWSKNGRNSYRKMGLYYGSQESYLQSVPNEEVDWEGFEDFKQAVNQVEMVIELRMAKVQLPS